MMKKISLLSLIGIFTIIACSFKGEEYKTLEIGAEAPMVDYEMESINGELFTINSLAKENGVLLIFSCNTCPFVVAWEDRYPELAELAEENGIGFALINSNQAEREGEDSMEEMQNHAKENGYGEIPYLVDKNSELANAFGGKTTPHVFLFNADLSLVYKGAIDDNHKTASEVKENYLQNAIQNLIAGNTIEPNSTKAIGCSIKRVKQE